MKNASDADKICIACVLTYIIVIIKKIYLSNKKEH